jgi:hypothetical protein
MPPEDFRSVGHQDDVGLTVLFEHLGCRGTPEAMSKFSAPPMVIGDNHEWGVLVSTFLLDHDPSRIMDFYQIFDRPPEGVGFKWDGASEGARLVPQTQNRTPSNRQANHSVTSGFQRKSTWSEILCSFGATPCCNISFLATPGCFNSIVNNNPLLIIDSGTLVNITPHRSDFISYQKSNMKIKDSSSSNIVAGEGLLRWNIADVAGRTVTLELPGYHVPGTEVCLLSPQVLLSTFGGQTMQTTQRVEVCL